MAVLWNLCFILMTLGWIPGLSPEWHEWMTLPLPVAIQSDLWDQGLGGGAPFLPLQIISTLFLQGESVGVGVGRARAWDNDSTMVGFRTWYFIIGPFCWSLLSPFYVRPCAEESMMHKHWYIPGALELTSNGAWIHGDNIQVCSSFLPHWPNYLGSVWFCGFQVVRFPCNHLISW